MATTATTRDGFLAALAERLSLMGVACDPADLEQWLASIWPIAEDSLDVWTWAAEYANGINAAAPACGSSCKPASG